VADVPAAAKAAAVGEDVAVFQDWQFARAQIFHERQRGRLGFGPGVIGELRPAAQQRGVNARLGLGK